MFHYIDNTLYCEDVPLADIAKAAGTPAYVYSSQIILDNYRAYDEGFGELAHMVCYAAKANSSLGILALLAKAGSGFDIVSAAEHFVAFAVTPVYEEGRVLRVARKAPA